MIKNPVVRGDNSGLLNAGDAAIVRSVWRENSAYSSLKKHRCDDDDDPSIGHFAFFNRDGKLEDAPRIEQSEPRASDTTQITDYTRIKGTTIN